MTTNDMVYPSLSKFIHFYLTYFIFSFTLINVIINITIENYLTLKIKIIKYYILHFLLKF